MRRLAVAALTLAAVSACGGSGITRTAVQDSVGAAFGNLYARQQTLLGRPGRTSASAQAVASCGRSGATGRPDAGGPGDDWRCTVVWVDATRLTRATYDLQVRPTGCYVAEGPAAVVGAQRLDLPTGGSAVNPLAAFDGCLDLS